jgi:two-component system phosphate regulon sensor histidine kinase PhoR
MCLLALITIVLATVQILGANYDLFQTQVQKQIENEALLISAGLNLNGDPVSHLRSLSFADPATRVTLINADGTVAYDNKADPAKMDNHITRPEVAEAIVGGQSKSVRTSATLGQRTFYFAKLLNKTQIIRVAITTQSIYLVFLRILPSILLMVLTVAVIVLFFSSGMTQKIIAP